MHITSRARLYLDGLQGAAEQHVVGRHQRAHGVVMGTDSVDFLQGLDVPHLHETRSSGTTTSNNTETMSQL